MKIFKVCPQCGKSNPQKLRSCPSCGMVLVTYVEGIKSSAFRRTRRRGISSIISAIVGCR